MNKIIDVNDVSTYPMELLSMFDNNLDNYEKVLSHYDFKCCHVCCTSDINNYYKYGIMRPFIVDGNNIKINNILKDIILKPISNYGNYEEYADMYDKLLFEEYKKNKNIIDNWYGKYSCVCYTMDCLSKINNDNPAYEPAINCYGGEIFRDIGFSDSEAENIARNFKSYVIFFRLSYDEIKKCKIILVDDLIEHMRLMYKEGKLQYGFEGNINKDIPSSDFIEVKELKTNE